MSTPVLKILISLPGSSWRSSLRSNYSQSTIFFPRLKVSNGLSKIFAPCSPICVTGSHISQAHTDCRTSIRQGNLSFSITRRQVRFKKKLLYRTFFGGQKFFRHKLEISAVLSAKLSSILCFNISLISFRYALLVHTNYILHLADKIFRWTIFSALFEIFSTFVRRNFVVFSRWFKNLK